VNRTLLARTWVVATVLGAVGLLAGILAAAVLTGKAPERYTAEATLAMLPSQQVPVTQAPGFWEVLSRGQATRSAAIVLADGKWLEGAATATGESAADVALEAGAISDTTLINVTMEANTAAAAEAGLNYVLANALAPAASASGPFRLEVVSSPEGSAASSAPARTQMFAALALAGVLVGSGIGFLVGQAMQRGAARRSGTPKRRRGNAVVSTTNGTVREQADSEPPVVQTPTT
jgi:hypothetical protein